MNSWKRYPYGCKEDYMNEQIAESMHAAHCDEHEAYPQKGCQWCEAEEEAYRFQQAEDFKAGIYAQCEVEDRQEAQAKTETWVKVKCPICKQLNVKGMYCTGCGWVPPRGEE